MSSQIFGLSLIAAGTFIFTYYTAWVFLVPTLPESSPYKNLFLSQDLAWELPFVVLFIGLAGIYSLFHKVGRIRIGGEDDARCEVCLEKAPLTQNPLVFCDGCNIAVHRFCYGKPLSYEIPKGNWFCDRCQSLNNMNVNAPTLIKCCICLKSKGCLKKIEAGPYDFVHILCINLIPEINFKNDMDKSLLRIKQSTQLQSRRNKKCSYCQQKSGLVISCDKATCIYKFHPYCLQDMHLLLPINIQKFYFCKKFYDQHCFDFNVLCKDHFFNDILQTTRNITDVLKYKPFDPNMPDPQLIFNIQKVISTFKKDQEELTRQLELIKQKFYDHDTMANVLGAQDEAPQPVTISPINVTAPEISEEIPTKKKPQKKSQINQKSSKTIKKQSQKVQQKKQKQPILQSQTLIQSSVLSQLQKLMIKYQEKTFTIDIEDTSDITKKEKVES